MDIILQLYSTVSVLCPNIDMLLFGLELMKRMIQVKVNLNVPAYKTM